MDIYKCINIDTSFIKKTKGEMYKLCPLIYLHYLYISPLMFYINDVSILIHLYMSFDLPALFIHLTFCLFYK
jgi:hypothetical protein